MELSDVLTQMRNKIRAEEIGPMVQTFMLSRIIKQFQALRSGGEARGVHWDPLKTDWYSRSDGVTVPIYGGVRWMNNPRRKVKGKLRSKNPEGKKRYTMNSALMQSTGMMRAALISDMRLTELGVSLGTPVKYAAWQNALRPFMFISHEEGAEIASMIARKLR